MLKIIPIVVIITVAVAVVVAAIFILNHPDFQSFCLGDVYHCGVAVREPDNSFGP